MEINIPLLIKYASENGFDITISIPISQNKPCLMLILGDSMSGNRRESLDFEDVYKILILNNIISDDPQSASLVKQQLDLPREHKDWPYRIERIETLIYDTLAKYILQLLLASTGELHYPGIAPLKKHEYWFKNR
jgi:hypothetical protein